MLKNVLSLKNIIWFCAIGLAVFSGYYSVYGISKLFAGGSFSIIGMAAMLELAKLVVVAFLHNYHSTLKTVFKIYLTSAALVLMGITSIGVYGYLTNSYQETAKVVNTTQNELVLLDQKRQIFEKQKAQVDDYIVKKTERVSQYDKLRVSQENTYSKLIDTKRGTRGLQQNIKGIEETAGKLNQEISDLSSKSMALTDSINNIDQKKLELTNSTFSSEMGPLLYLSRITGRPMDEIVNWFILFLVIVFDPLAVSLVIAANHISKLPRTGTGKTFSDLTGEFPGGKNDHPGGDSEPLPEPPEEWLDDGITDTEKMVDVIDNDVVDENSDNLEISKEVHILDQDPDQEDPDQLDQVDQKDQEDQVDQIAEAAEAAEAVEEVTFQEKQSFYNELAHRVNRASGGI